ncbi:MAG: hypothetical protein AB7I52_17335, partial [Rhizobiaceae bacterium]
MHKAIPFGNVGHEYFMVDDVNDAATSFPEMNFEIFHGGFAFLEDTVLKATYNSNVTINLEGTSALIFYAPERLAHIHGSLAQAGAADRIPGDRLAPRTYGAGIPGAPQGTAHRLPRSLTTFVRERTDASHLCLCTDGSLASSVLSAPCGFRILGNH